MTELLTAVFFGLHLAGPGIDSQIGDSADFILDKILFLKVFPCSTKSAAVLARRF